ncbi:MAG: PAS domain S-box protein [Thiobacillus sp.]|nr:PAS domain S-box protein [Thiobacillus sp.]
MNSDEIQFHALVENSPEAVVVGLGGRYVYVNAAAVRLFGATSAEQLLGQAILDRVHPDYRAIVAGRMHRLTEAKEVCPPLDEVFLRMDGTPVDVEVYTVPLHLGDEDGAVAFVRDISARKSAEAVLRSQAERHETLLATSGDGFWICDLEGRILEVNEAFSRMSGYTCEELLKLRIPDIEAAENSEETAQHIRNIMTNGYDRFESRHRRKDGELYEVEILTSYWAAQERILVFQRDITARKQAEAELSRNRELLRSIQVSRALTEAMGMGVIGADVEHRVIFANPAAQKLLGIGENDMLGRKLDDVVRAVTGEGSVLTEATCPCWKSIDAGQPFQTEDWTFARHDGSRFPVSLVIAPLPEDATPTGSVLSFQDISARKQAEQALLDADRRKDEFLAMLAHELRNPLAPIRNAAFILGRLELDEPRLKWVQEVIEDQVQHLSRLTDELLDVSRIVQGKIELKNEAIEFVALLAQILATARPMLESRGQHVAMRLPRQPVWLNGDPVRLTQVISNLLDNASKYTQAGGAIELDADVTGQEIAFRVRDNGPGISAELLPHVFDLFQQGDRTLDRAQGGLGIGLTLVRQLVTMHGGRVDAYSAGTGQGATFTIRLPIVAAPAPASKSPPGEPTATGGRILVVDDEPAVADSMAALLELMGYEVAVAESGQAALEQVPAFRPQVVLLDIGLKGMDGFETARRLRQLPQAGEMFLVAVTGYADEAAKRLALASGCDHHIAKPGNPDALLALIAAWISKCRHEARPDGKQ